MFNVKISLGIPLEQLERGFYKGFQRGLRDLANDAYKFWGDEAGRQLHQTEQAYRDALKLHKVDPDTYEITLQHSEERINFLVTALEVGYKGFDIKPGLLRSPSATHWSQFAKQHEPGGTKPGRFLDVPFRDKKDKSGNLIRKQGKPNRYVRLTENSSGWMHPGFRPVGAGGLKRPLREAVKERIQEQAVKVLIVGPLKGRFGA